MLDELLKAIKDKDPAGMRKILQRAPELALSPRVVCAAAQVAHQKVLMELMRQGANLNGIYRGYRPLHALIQEKPHNQDKRSATRPRLACMNWMIEHGADPEQLGAFPPARAILIAAFTGERAFVDELRKAGAKVDGYVHAALGDLDEIRAALDRQPVLATSRDAGGLTALQCAIYSGMGRDDSAVAEQLYEIAALLVDRGADLHATTKGWSNDLSVSYFAVNGGNKKIFQMLLDRGMHATDSLSATVWKNLTDWTELAMQHGARLNDARDEGKPLLNQMIRWGQLEQAHWMLGKGADPNIPDERGWTAVHQAASRGNIRMIEAVLQAGGDPRRKSVDGELPYVLARRVEIRKLFPSR